MNTENLPVISDINDATTVIAHSGKRFSITERKFYGLSFCKKGKITYTHGDKSFVSDCDNAIFLPYGASYTLYNHSQGEFPLINFTCENLFIDDFAVFPIKSPEDYINDYERIKKYLHMPSGKLKAIGILYDIIYRLFNEAECDYLLSPALKCISENLHSADLSNDKIASSANISESYLRKLFKKQFSRTPKQYVIELRIERAKSQLCETNYNITVISEKCGFSNVYHFCRAFKECVGLTPTEYRKHHTAQGI